MDCGVAGFVDARALSQDLAQGKFSRQSDDKQQARSSAEMERWCSGYIEQRTGRCQIQHLTHLEHLLEEA